MTTAINYGTLGAGQNGAIGAAITIGDADTPIATEPSSRSCIFPGSGSFADNIIMAAGNTSFMDGDARMSALLWTKMTDPSTLNHLLNDYDSGAGAHFSLYNPGGSSLWLDTTTGTDPTVGGIDLSGWMLVIITHGPLSTDRSIMYRTGTTMTRANAAGASGPLTTVEGKFKVGGNWASPAYVGKLAGAALWENEAMSLADAQLLLDKALGTGGASGYWAAIEAGTGLSSVGAAEIAWRMNETTNASPTITNLTQKDSSNVAVVDNGYVLDGEIRIGADLADPDAQTVKLEVELRPQATPFSGTATHSTALAAEPHTASVTIAGLAEGQYHWQARAVDSLGGVSAWTAGAADQFIHNTVPSIASVAIQPIGGGLPTVTKTLEAVLTGRVDGDPAAVVADRYRWEKQVAGAGLWILVRDWTRIDLDPTASELVVSGNASEGDNVKVLVEPYDTVEAGAQVEHFVAVVNAAPDAPTNLDQIESVAQGGASIVVGGVVVDGIVQFEGDVSDPDLGDTARLELEIQPIGVSFTNVATHVSLYTPNPTTGFIFEVSGISPGSYHWQARTFDGTDASPWVSFGANPEANPDFRVNAAPGAPASLDQYDLVGAASIVEGGSIAYDFLKLSAISTDPDADQWKLQVEVKPTGTAFNGATGLHLASGFSASGAASEVILVNFDNGNYHWRGRAIDQYGAASGWSSFGAAAEPNDVDFTIAVVAPPSGETSQTVQDLGSLAGPFRYID